MWRKEYLCSKQGWRLNVNKGFWNICKLHHCPAGVRYSKSLTHIDSTTFCRHDGSRRRVFTACLLLLLLHRPMLFTWSHRAAHVPACQRMIHYGNPGSGLVDSVHWSSTVAFIDAELSITQYHMVYGTSNEVSYTLTASWTEPENI